MFGSYSYKKFMNKRENFTWLESIMVLNAELNNNTDILKSIFPFNIKIDSFEFKQLCICSRKKLGFEYNEKVFFSGSLTITIDTNPVELSFPSVKSIGCGVFKDLNNLEKVVIPKTVDEIYPEAFSNCKKLKEVILPNGLKILNAEIFANCTELEKINIPNSVLELGNMLFLNCKKLKNISISNNVIVWNLYNQFIGCDNLENICYGEILTNKHDLLYWFNKNARLYFN